MADRLPQSSYPHIQNFNPSMLQQQHNQQQSQLNQTNQLSQAQQQQMQQLQDLQPGQVGNMPMQDNNARLWQQMSQLPQFRGAGQGMDTTNQMADLLRTRSMMQQQHQHQQHQQQQFSLGVNQLGGHPPHQPPFHDQSGGQPNMPPGFGNMGLGNAMASGGVAAFRALQASRQLGLISMAQNQQNQNAPGPALVAHMQAMQREQAQQQQQMQGAQPDIFTPPSMGTPDGIRRSPSHTSPQPPQNGMPPNMPQNPEGAQAPGATPTRRMMTLNELRERANQVRTMITTSEQALSQLSSNRGGLPEQTFIQKSQVLQNDLKNKREYLHKLSAAIQLQTQGNGQFPGMGGGMQPQFPPGPPGQPNGWANPQVSSFGPHQGQQHLNGHPNGLQQSPANLHAQANQLGGIPPRSGPTPTQQQREQMQKEQQQRLGAPFNQASPSNQPFPFSMTGRSSTPNPTPGPNGASPNPNGMPSAGPMLHVLPPLAKSRFDDAYASFCKSKNIQHDPRLMLVEGRPIDLHNLHRNVLMEGGFTTVTQKDLWAVIGARMNFVAFPASETEPAKSGPQTAIQLAHIYKEYLAAFDAVYITSMLDQKRRQQMMNNNAAVDASGSGPSINPSRFSPGQIQQMFVYASQSAAELRARGVEEKVIQFVENNRANLQRTMASQSQFRDQLRSGGLVPPGMNVGPQMAMANHPDEGQGHQAFGNPPRSNTPMSRPPMPNGPQMPLVGIGSLVMRSDPQFTSTAMKVIQRLKENIPTQMEQLVQATATVLPEQRVEYNNLIEHVFRNSQDFEVKLPMFFVLLRNDEMVKKLIAINYTIATQRTLLASNQPRFVVGLENLRSMSAELGKAKEIFQSALATFVKARGLAPNGGGPVQQPAHGSPPNMQPMPQLPQAPPPNPNPMPTARPPVPPQPRPPPQQKPKQPIQPSPSTSTMTAPTPPATLPNPSTPAASASSPNLTNSPQIPKSPKPKPPAKPKAPVAPAKRRPSKVGPASPIPPVAEPPRPPSTSAGVKRQREDDNDGQAHASTSTPGTSASHAEAASPPKRMKTEWDASDGPLMDPSSDKQVIDSIKTPEDATAFMEQITQLIKLASDGGQTSITNGISSTIDEILRIGGAADLPLLDPSHLPSGSDLPSQPADNEFEEFFNFASFANDDDDAGSKAATPDLIASSSANTSPESNAETDAAHHLGVDIKTEEMPDPLRVGIWKEIDGGESSFYHTHDFKWEGTMPPVEWSVPS